MSDPTETRFTTQRATHAVGDYTVALEARALRLRAPWGGFVWNRPVAAVVRGPGGETRLPIRDVTRRGQLALYGVALLCVVAGLIVRDLTGRRAKALSDRTLRRRPVRS